jgi:hypothetical protein
MKKTISALVGAGLMASPLLVLAQDVSVNANANVNAGANAGTGGMQVQAQANMGASAGVEAKITKAKEQADKEIDRRVANLTKLSTRISGATHISAEGKTSITNQINTQITALQNLKTQIGAEASSTVLGTHIDLLEGNTYSLYSLVMQQLALTAAADRVVDVADAMNGVAGKLEARLSATTTSASSTAVTALADMKAKIASAQAKATEAVGGIANLQPSNGDKAVQQTNRTALAAARTKVQAAQADLVAARKSMGTVLKELHISASVNANANATTSATTP